METTGVSNELEQALQAFLAQRAVGASDREATTDRLLLALVAENRRLRAGLQELVRRYERLAQLGTSTLIISLACDSIGGQVEGGHHVIALRGSCALEYRVAGAPEPEQQNEATEQRLAKLRQAHLDLEAAMILRDVHMPCIPTAV
ncbi:MAG: hypothetical protein HGA19_17105 [Oscillochloris sp.]|nr:hypothetical protein [Oscillochloris sp.]